MSTIIEHLVWSHEGTEKVIIKVVLSRHRDARHGCYGNRVRDPFVEDDLQRHWLGAEVTVKLDLEEVTLNKRIEGDALISRGLESFRCYCQRDLALLKVKVDRSENGHDCLGRVGGGVERTVGSRDIVVEVALRHSVEGDDGGWDVGLDIHNNLAIGQHVGLWQVVKQEEHNLDRSCLAYWKLYGTLHGMKLHFSYVSSGLIDHY